MKKGMVVIALVISSCQGNISNSNTDDCLFNFEKRDTILNDSTVCLRSFFQFDYGSLILINKFKKDSFFELVERDFTFYLRANLGLEIIYNDITFNNIIGLNYEDCENNFCVFSGDSIDNIEGFNPVILENNLSRIIILEGYPYECNGSYCNAGSILILKFKNKRLQRSYLFGIDKTIHSLNNIKGEFLANDEFVLHFFRKEQESPIDIIFDEKIELLNKEKPYWELGYFCINPTANNAVKSKKKG